MRGHEPPTGAAAGRPSRPLPAAPDRAPAVPRREPAEDGGSRDSSLQRALDVVGLISVETPTIRVDDVIAHLGYSRSTAYRYMRELSDAGLLVSRLAGQYSLGPRILQFQRLIEMTDPLYRAGQAVMPGFDRPNAVLLLQEIVGDEQVICLHRVGAEALVHGTRRLPLVRARGLPLPLFRGSASLALLAWLPPYRMRQAYLSGAAAIAEAGLGGSWAAFRKRLTAIRRRGYAVSRSDRTLLVGVGVPILSQGENRLLGSLARVRVTAQLPPQDEPDEAEELHAAARQISRHYDRLATASNTHAEDDDPDPQRRM